ncbi:MAG: 3'-5' exonuclease [Anaerolineae bacterium]|nr:3'-5' exonuclease [Anaerolineae bacterium]
MKGQGQMDDFRQRARERAIKWAGRMMALEDFRIFDTETTGLDSRAQAVQVAVIDKSGAVLLDALVKPTVPIPADAARIHGITDVHVIDAPAFDALYPELARVLADRHVIAYNLKFDLRILDQTRALYGLPPLPVDPVARADCAMEWFAAYYGDWHSRRRSFTWKPLNFACQTLGVPASDFHAAAADCVATLGVVQALAALA